LQYSVEVSLLLSADTVAANLPVGYSLQIQRFNELIDRELFWKVGLVAENQEWYTVEYWLFEERMKLFASNR